MASANTDGLGGIVVQTLAATGMTKAYCPEPGGFNVDVSGTWSGSWKLQRSFDNGANYSDYTLLDQAFAPTTNASTELAQIEENVLWRVNATLSSGSLTVRLSQ